MACRRTIADLNYEKLPIDVTVLLDVSASVSGSVLDELRRSLRQLRADLGARDRLRLITFDMRIRRLVDFTQAAAATDDALASLGSAGSSAVFDSLAVALTAAAPAGRRQLIMLFSDGQDSSSISDAETLLDAARRSTPTVALVLASPSTQTSRVPGPQRLQAGDGDDRRPRRSDCQRYRRLRGRGRIPATTSRRRFGESSSSFARPTSCTSRRTASSARVLTRSKCA